MSDPTLHDDIRERPEAHHAPYELSDELKQRCEKLVAFLESEEWHGFWTPTKDALRGDATGLLGWTQQRIGHKPNPMLRVQITDKALGEKTPAEIWGLVAYHGGLRTVRVRAASTSQRILRIREGIRRYASLDEALRVLRDDPGEPLERVLLREIEEAVCSPELPELSDKELVRYITNDIRCRGRERHKQQKMMREALLIAPPDDPSWGIGSFEEQVLLREYAREDERRWGETKKRAGITPFEDVVLEHDLSSLGLEGKLNTAKVAIATGLAVGTIKSQRSRYRSKLRRVI